MLKKTFQLGILEIRFNLIVFLFVLALLGVLVNLGLWQLRRAQEKIDLQEDYSEMQQDEAATLDTLPIAGLEYDKTQLQNRQVVLHGRFLNDRSVFLVFQTFEDQIGYEIFTPFLNRDSDEIVLVSRGWTGAASYEELVRALPEIAGEQEVTGQIYVHTQASLKKENSLDDINWPLQVRYMNVPQLTPLLEQRVYPYVVRMAESQPGILVRYWPEVFVNTSQHFSYALQWFSMAIALVIVTLILSSNLMTLIQNRIKPL